MRNHLLLILFVLPLACWSQTNISGVINSYHKVIEVIPSKSCVRVQDKTGLNYNDMVMLIQMKGAVISTANNSGFGAVSSINNAGNYELQNICSIKGDSIFFFKTILQNYTVADKVQLVRIPRYNNAMVIDTLKALAWDSASGKGGVLALSVVDQLILSAPINADGVGYKGGAYANSNTTCSNFLAATNWYYDATSVAPQNGAWKGESVTTTAAGFTGGKGAPANGGGGGNNHNNGGGGGANLSAGGTGGGNSSASGCTAANPGMGGYALSSSSGTKIFIGGGGGAGHANSGLIIPGGGSGGGIVFIQANTIYCNGHLISANGAKGGSTIGDGASGGGGGGTIILDINFYPDPLLAEAAGGNGGDESDDMSAGKCYGEGGGGSGGIIYFKSSQPAGTISVTAGTKGIKSAFTGCGTLKPASDGTAGIMVTGYNYQRSATVSTFCSGGPLATTLQYFTAEQRGSGILLEWRCTQVNEYRYFRLERRTDSKDWTFISQIDGNTGNVFQYTDKDLQPGVYQYRLLLVHQDGHASYSIVAGIRIFINEKDLILFPNPAHTNLTLLCPKGQDGQLQLIDALGHVLLSRKYIGGEAVKLDVSNFPRGLYVVTNGRWKQSVLVE